MRNFDDELAQLETYKTREEAYQRRQEEAKQDRIQRENKAKSVKIAWEKLQGKDTIEAIEDLLDHLDTVYATHYSTALQETENGTKAVGYLQRALAYDTIRTYIRQKLDRA